MYHAKRSYTGMSRKDILFQLQPLHLEPGHLLSSFCQNKYIPGRGTKTPRSVFRNRDGGMGEMACSLAPRIVLEAPFLGFVI